MLIQEAQQLRDAIHLILINETFNRPISRMRKTRFGGDIIISNSLKLSEDYVTGVLGFNRTFLTEAAIDAKLNAAILYEHLIFEGWWSNAKDKIVAVIKDNPITSAVDATKRLGDGINGVVAALTGVVGAGGNVIDTVIKGAKNLASKGITGITKTISQLLDRIQELVSKLGAAAKKKAELIVGKIKGFISGFGDKVNSLMEGTGWTAMLAILTAYLAVDAVRGKIGKFVASSLTILSGDVKKMIAGAVNLKSQVDDALEGDDDDEAEEEVEPEDENKDDDTILATIQNVWASVKNLAWGFVKKAVGAAGIDAVTSLAGPVGWITTLAKTFTKIAGGMAWVCEHIMAAISRATFGPKPLGGSPPASA